MCTPYRYEDRRYGYLEPRKLGQFVELLHNQCKDSAILNTPLQQRKSHIYHNARQDER